MEIWKDIECYEGYYQVSNEGRVRGLDRIIIGGSAGGYCYHHWKGRILKFGFRKKCRYFNCILCKDSRKSYLVHRLVAKTFIPNSENKPQINHINGNRKDNRVENLEWMTSKENMQNAFDTGLINVPKGKNHHKARTVIQLDMKGKKIKRYDCIADAERELKINQSNIVSVCRKRDGHKMTGGFRWKYVLTKD